MTRVDITDDSPDFDHFPLEAGAFADPSPYESSPVALGADSTLARPDCPPTTQPVRDQITALAATICWARYVGDSS